MRKFFLGPAGPSTCKVCGRKVGVPYLAMLAVGIPFWAAIIFFPPVESVWLGVFLLIVGFAASSLAFVYRVPLVKR